MSASIAVSIAASFAASIAAILVVTLAAPPASPTASAPASTAPVSPAPRDMSSQPAAPAVEGPVPAPTPVTAPPLSQRSAPPLSQRSAPPRGICHGSRPCKRLVALGAVTGVLGVATIVAGAVVAARPIAVDPDDPTMAIAYRPAGTAVLTIGIGVLATSVLMAVAAARASRQANRRRTVASRTAMTH